MDDVRSLSRTVPPRLTHYQTAIERLPQALAGRVVTRKIESAGRNTDPKTELHRESSPRTPICATERPVAFAGRGNGQGNARRALKQNNPRPPFRTTEGEFRLGGAGVHRSQAGMQPQNCSESVVSEAAPAVDGDEEKARDRRSDAIAGHHEEESSRLGTNYRRRTRQTTGRNPAFEKRNKSSGRLGLLGEWFSALLGASLDV